MDFYEELISSIKELIEEKKYDEARKKINDELTMAYVPMSVEETLLTFLDRIDELSPTREKELSIDEIIAYLNSKDLQQQVIAANYFDRLNVRDYLDVIEEFLLSEYGYDEAKTMLVSTLIDQEIKEEIKMNKDGMNYKFIPYYIIKVEESDGYLKAMKIFDKELFKNPSYYKMAVQLFTNKAYESLPINIDEQEAKDMAYMIIRHVYRLFDDKEGLESLHDSIINEDNFVH